MKKLLLTSILFLSVTALFAQTKVGGKVELQSGYVKLEQKNIWETIANAKLSVNSTITKSIRTCVETDLGLYTVPETDYTTAGFLATATLSKAYFKMRFPMGENNSFRLNIGKQPFSMGYGLYYNAGDLIFGADPNSLVRSDTSISFNNVKIRPEVAPALAMNGITSADQLLSDNENFSGLSLDSSSLSDLRVLTDWIVDLQFSFNDLVALDFLALPPVDTTLNSNYGRYGTKITYRADKIFLENMEAGTLIQGNAKKAQAYLAFDGTLWLDYNLCSSITFDDAKGDVEFNEDLWNISLGLCKIFSIQTDTANHNLTARIEALYHPIAKSLNIFTYLSYDITDKINVCAYYLFTAPELSESENFTHTIGANFSYKPISSITLSLTGLIRADAPQKLSAVLLGAKAEF